MLSATSTPFYATWGYTLEAEGFSDSVDQLIQAILAERMKPDAEPAAIARSVVAHLDRSSDAGWLEEDRDELLARLRPGTQREKAITPRLSAPQELATADADRFLKAAEANAAERFEVAWHTIEPLTAAYPNSYRVQELACRVALSLGDEMHEIRGRCRRMSELALQGHAK
ncbi:MAG: hypothetical protein MJD61_00810 [Proteobacteria bacterium]|nr:hypothetical protein [Pseudomonadota bacterium]